MDLPQDYSPVTDEEGRPQCHLLAMMPPASDRPDAEAIAGQFEAAGLPVEALEPGVADEFPEAEWVLDGRTLSTDENEAMEFQVWAHLSERMDEMFFEWAGLVEQEQIDVKQSRWSVGLSTVFGDNPLTDLHRQMKLLSAAAPDAVMVMDKMAAKPYAGEWLREIASSIAPPSPANLYSIHAVRDEENPGAGAWLHTHGLLRCGSIELEMLDIPEPHVGLMGDLLNVIAPMFIEQGVPEPGQPFAAGAGIDLVWLPWEEAVQTVSSRAGGGIADRDESHAHPSGVLLTPKTGFLRKRHRSPAAYIKRLQRDPLLFISSMETERMSLLAKERLGEFSEMFSEHGADDENYVFLVKLGYTVDDAEDPSDREHLWFQVHEISGERVHATLTNQPYGIARLREGEKDWHPLDLLSDWAILCKLGQFGPDSLVHLRRLLAEEAQAEPPDDSDPATP